MIVYIQNTGTLKFYNNPQGGVMDFISSRLAAIIIALLILFIVGGYFWYEKLRDHFKAAKKYTKEKIESFGERFRKEVEGKKLKDYFNKIVMAINVFIALTAVILIFVGSSNPANPEALTLAESLNWNWGWFMLFIQIAWIFLSFHSLQPDEQGVLLFFGKPVSQHGSGLVFVPFPFIKLVRMLSSDVSEELPAEPAKVDKKSQDDPAPGKVPPIRIVHSELESSFLFNKEKSDFSFPFSDFGKTEEGRELQKALRKDPLNARLTTEVNLLLIYAISDPIQYVQRVSKEGGEVGRAKVRQRINDAAIAALQAIMARVTPSEALLHLDVISKRVLASVEEMVGEPKNGGDEKNPDWWGIDVKQLTIIQVDPGETVNKETAKAVAAGFKRRETVQNAEAEKQKLIMEGEGRASATLANLLAEAEGAQKLAEIALSSEGKFVLDQRAAIEVASKAKYSIIAGEHSILGGVAGIAEGLKRIQNDQPVNPPKEVVEK